MAAKKEKDELKSIKEQVNEYIVKQGVDLSSDDFSWYYGQNQESKP